MVTHISRIYVGTLKLLNGQRIKNKIDCIRQIKISLHIIEFAYFASCSSRQEKYLHRALHTWGIKAGKVPLKYHSKQKI